jgi:hypothetical protein
MAQRSTIERLPREIREWLEGELLRRGFADYAEVTELLNQRLTELGASTSKSAVHRFGRNVEERIAQLKRSTEIARTLASEVGDDEGAMNDALVRLTQDKLFHLLVDMEIDPADVDITKLGRVIADLGRASVAQKKHQMQTRAAIEAKLAALDAESKGEGGGLDQETLRRVREEIYGVV